ncbi:kelch repeat and BTB domain-containing protein 2-like isoform X1 [Branchiostoma floridae x Branchiostoma japonicum]
MNVSNSAHSGEVLCELNSQRERAELTDVVLEVGGRSFPCHRAVLASCSPYFRGMFTSDYAEAKQERVSIQDVSPVAMATILDYAYTGRLQTEPDQVQAVMSAAKLLQVDFVCKEAVEYMKNHLDVSNCADVLMYADMLGDLDLVEYSGQYMASRFDQVALQPSFLQLPLALLQSLLTRDDLLTNSEDDVLQAALRWVEFDQDERLRHLPSLCLSFRRSFLSSNQLVDLEKKCPSTDIKLVYSDSTTRRLGQTRTEMQIFVRVSTDFRMSAPCYDPSTGELYTMTMPDDVVGYSMAVTSGDELYLAGGVADCPRKVSDDFKGCKKLKKFYQYNHLMDTWEQRCDMISPRVRCGLVYLKGYIYAIVGDDAKKTAEKYDPSRDEWTSIPPLPYCIFRDFCSVALGDSIYVITAIEGCFCFSTTDNTWSRIADMSEPMAHLQAVVHQGSIYCTGNLGRHSSVPVKMYNPTKDEWKQSGKSHFASDTTILTKYGETMYLLEVHKNRGEDQSIATIDIHQYQPETDSWLFLHDKGRLVPPMVHWLCSLGFPDTLHLYCLAARMVPECLWEDHTGVFKDLPDHGEGSGISDDSNGEDDLSDQEDDGSGSDNNNI